MAVTPTLRIDPDGKVFALSGAVLAPIEGRAYAIMAEWKLSNF